MLITLLQDILVWIHLACALILTIYALHAYGILAVLLRRTQARVGPAPALSDSATSTWPDVVTQVPLYNEANVAERVLRAVAAMDYPGRHHIQVLDDSNDETRDIVDRVAAGLRACGYDIAVVRRSDRSGFKAGALAHGLKAITAEYIAVFDADFVPPRDFLLRTIPQFERGLQVGFVQGRWTFLNDKESLLTRAQAVGLDSHFAIEQSARFLHPAMCINFNGTAGVWRRAAIEAGGGWSDATLTEDLDLSYRAQLAGWRGVFLPDLEVPGELPATFAGFKSQQFRWAKGSMQTALRLLPRVWRSKTPLSGKVEASFHMTHYAVHPLLLIVILLTPLTWLQPAATSALPGIIGVLLLAAAFAPTVFYGFGQYRLHGDWRRRLWRLPTLTLAGMGLAVANARAIAEALLGRRSAFIRTPKAGDQQRRSYRVRFPVPPWFELALGVYAAAGAMAAWQAGHFGVAKFGLLCSASLFFIGGGSLRELLAARRRSERQPARAITVSSDRVKQPEGSSP